nr:MAG TPA_asm: hypothetical protein [Bacteriophage sp.]
MLILTHRKNLFQNSHLMVTIRVDLVLDLLLWIGVNGVRIMEIMQ